MIRFLLKGLLRDSARSRFPVIVVAAGVALTVFLHAWIGGAESSLIDGTARFRTGHVRVMSRGYAAHVTQAPNDLALLDTDSLVTALRASHPALRWQPRIVFGGLLDVPDSTGETREQAPVSGIGAELLAPGSAEIGVLNLARAVVRGRLPAAPGEVLVADGLADRLHLQPGAKVTLISSTMYGSMAFKNFTVCGTLRFGAVAMDRGTIVADIADIRDALDMRDGAGEILGFFDDGQYHENEAEALAAEFNGGQADATDKFAPVMGAFREQSGMADYMDMLGGFSRMIIGIFVAVMSLVLWNAGLTGTLRRYGEFGLRLATGEDKGHVYRSMIVESFAVGVAGSCAGTLIGLGFAWYLQVHGLDIGGMMKNSSVLLSDVVHARITPVTCVIGFLPGIAATLLGSAFSGMGIYKRQTSQLFKELET